MQHLTQINHNLLIVTVTQQAWCEFTKHYVGWLYSLWWQVCSTVGQVGLEHGFNSGPGILICNCQLMGGQATQTVCNWSQQSPLSSLQILRRCQSLSRIARQCLSGDRPEGLRFGAPNLVVQLRALCPKQRWCHGPHDWLSAFRLASWFCTSVLHSGLLR